MCDQLSSSITSEDTKPTTANQDVPELREARRNVALGKLTAFDRECWRLAGLVHAGNLTVAAAVDALAEADVANGLSAAFGGELVHEIMFDAFAAGICGREKPRGVEVAA
jgi:hypothetical protein